MTRRKGEVKPGHFYGITKAGEFVPLDAADDGLPGLWICRRLADFPDGHTPDGAAVGICTRCGATLVFNPARVEQLQSDTPKVCMQCVGIDPMPLPATPPRA